MDDRAGKVAPLKGGGDLTEQISKKEQEVPAQDNRRGYVWQCIIPANKEKFLAQPDAKREPCGHWNATYTTKYARGKTEYRWQAKCSKCGRKRQLSLGNVFPEAPNYYDSLQAAQNNADRRNEPAPPAPERFL